MDFIRGYESINGFNLFYSKAAHKYLVKAFYGRTNKKNNFEK